MIPPNTLHEEERLAVLRECRVLDTEPERAFDDLVELAAHVCDAPISLISLIDETRQWFKARVGLQVTETPREWAFCHHAIQGDEPMEVVDALRDPRFSANPLVFGEPHIRYYYGVPLAVEPGHALGTLCVIDRRPRHLEPEQAELLQVLARLAVDQIEARRRTQLLTDALERVRTLEELLPVCASCKKVRQEEGYWRRVEDFLEHHGAHVTHGLCPACEARANRDL